MSKYKTTKHAEIRQAQRGITSSMVDYVLTNGVDDSDKIILGRQQALQLLAALKEEERLLMKILDKGGVVVVAKGDSIITTYNRTSSYNRTTRCH